MNSRLLVTVWAALIAIGCSQRVNASGSIVGTSETLIVRGSYSPVTIDRVDRLSIESGKLVLHGSSAVPVELPPSAAPDQPNPHWTLVTESESGITRQLTFTHETSLEEFTIELPASEAPVRYGGLSGRDGNDVLVLAWGEGSRSYHADLTIVRKNSTPK
jgi:hypothetical protein